MPTLSLYPLCRGYAVDRGFVHGCVSKPWIRVGRCGIHGSPRIHAYPHHFGNHEAVDTRGYTFRIYRVPIGTILKSGEVFVAVLSHIVSQSAFSCPADTTKMNLKF